MSFLRFTVLLLLFTLPISASADSIKKLLMPGPVVEAHSKIEEDCDKCHDTASKTRQGNLCMNCHSHENIRHDIDTKAGFHGRLPPSQQADCKHCHTEHKGRNESIILLNPSTFDHSGTDFRLEGVHGTTPCSRCHVSGKKYSDAPSACYACHRKSDVHEGKQGKMCGKCHSASSWKQTGFDHDKETDFPLKGKHREARCDTCHLNQQYRDTPEACFDCHRIDDVHHGEFGSKCNECHSPDRWDRIVFDHDRETEFPLRGSHKRTGCSRCHKSDNLKQELPVDCYGCHRHDDSHKGSYGRKCGNCHHPTSWQKHTFDHSGKTDFPLYGKHRALHCSQCHRGDLETDKLETGCYSCHRIDDVHRGKQGKQCKQCHNEKGWTDGIRFDHDLSPFPLIGMHAATQCAECHLSTSYTDTPRDCNSCHSSDDVHKTRLGTVCEDCHNPNSWKNWLFDHEKTTGFKIDGAHKDLGCYDCHATRSSGRLEASSDCISCHRSRDIHNRQFGRQCGQCHSTETFRNARFRQ